MTRIIEDIPVYSNLEHAYSFRLMGRLSGNTVADAFLILPFLISISGKIYNTAGMNTRQTEDAKSRMSSMPTSSSSTPVPCLAKWKCKLAPTAYDINEYKMRRRIFNGRYHECSIMDRLNLSALYIAFFTGLPGIVHHYILDAGLLKDDGIAELPGSFLAFQAQGIEAELTDPGALQP